MTAAQGFPEAIDTFAANLEATVADARRIAAQARETSERFRQETRELIERTTSGELPPTSQEELTPGHLRRSATSFRADQGLPVDQLPEGAQLLEQPSSLPQPTTVSPTRTTGPGRRFPRPNDDDEDFSQERIMR